MSFNTLRLPNLAVTAPDQTLTQCWGQRLLPVLAGVKQRSNCLNVILQTSSFKHRKLQLEMLWYILTQQHLHISSIEVKLVRILLFKRFFLNQNDREDVKEIT